MQINGDEKSRLIKVFLVSTAKPVEMIAQTIKEIVDIRQKRPKTITISGRASVGTNILTKSIPISFEGRSENKKVLEGERERRSLTGAEMNRRNIIGIAAQNGEVADKNEIAIRLDELQFA